MRRVPFERILSVRLLKHVAGGCAAPVQGEVPVGIAQIVAAERETAGAVARSGAGGADAEGRIAVAAEVIVRAAASETICPFDTVTAVTPSAPPVCVRA